MTARIGLTISLFAIFLGLCGCRDPYVPVLSQDISVGSREATVTTKESAVSLELLAARLGLRVAERTSTHVVLRNAANTVMIFTHAGGQFFVNGRPAGEVGQITEFDGSIYVPESLIEKIRTAMGGAGIYRPSMPRALSGTVVIDAGHGGKDPGALNKRLGLDEKTINLSVARKTAALLRNRGLRVIMTRDSDRFVELERRAEIANLYNADLFVSIHADWIWDRSRTGFTVYVAEAASYKSQLAARAIANQMARISPNGHGIRKEDFRVLVKTKMPAVLVEMGYISNRGEAVLIASNSFQNRIAGAIAAGICDVIERM